MTESVDRITTITDPYERAAAAIAGQDARKREVGQLADVYSAAVAQAADQDGAYEAAGRLGIKRNTIYKHISKANAKESGMYVVELYEGPADVIGEEWDGSPDLPAEVWSWLEEQGYGTDRPDLWVNLVKVGSHAPNNRPMAEYSTAISV